jgi:hypothetical protein
LVSVNGCEIYGALPDRAYSLQVNTVSTLLLADLMLPVLGKTAAIVDAGSTSNPRLTIVSSFVHFTIGDLKGRDSGNMLHHSLEEAKANYSQGIYAQSKSKPIFRLFVVQDILKSVLY